MKGNIEERRDNRWCLRVFVGRENGHTWFVTRSFEGTKRQAQTAPAKFVTEVEIAQVAKSHQGSVGDLLDRWLEDITPTRSAYAVRSTAARLRRTSSLLSAPFAGTPYRCRHSRGTVRPPSTWTTFPVV